MLIAVVALAACSEYGIHDEKTGSDGETLDAHDTADTAVDTGTVDTGDPDTREDGPDPDTGSDPCASPHTVRIGVTADDWWEGWFLGQHFGPEEHWWETTWTEFQAECGTYTLAVYATDLHEAISGFIGQVEVDGVIVSQTGDGSWKVYPTDPGGSEWRRSDYDDSAWTAGQPCDVSAATGWWGNSPEDLTGAGAWWLWPRDCLALGDAAFRLTVTVE